MKRIIGMLIFVFVLMMAGTAMAQETTPEPVLDEIPVETLAPTDVPAETPLATETPMATASLEQTLEVTAEPTAEPTQVKGTPTCEVKLNGGDPGADTAWNGEPDVIVVTLKNVTHPVHYEYVVSLNHSGNSLSGSGDLSGDGSWPITITYPQFTDPIWGQPLQDGSIWKYYTHGTLWIGDPCADSDWDHWKHVNSIPTPDTPETPEVSETPSPTPTGETEQPPTVTLTVTPPATATLPPGERWTPTPESGTPVPGGNVPQGPNTGDFQIQPVGLRIVVSTPVPTQVVWEQGPAESSTTFGMTPSGQVSLPHYGVSLPVIEAPEGTQIAEQAVGHALKVSWPNGNFTIGVHRSAWNVAGWIENETLIIDGVSYLLTNKRVMSKEEAAALEPSVNRFITCTADFKQNVVYDLVRQGK